MKIQSRYEYDPDKDLLGKGGFARVFRAHDTLLDRYVALKVFSNNQQHTYSVLTEIKKVIQFEHPNLLRYYDVILLEHANALGETEQTQIGVMELANAGDLKDFAKANPGSPLLYKLLKDVLLGLEYLHSKGIIHRDLKAQNILLVKQDGVLTAKISDFGISKDTATGGQSSSMMVGTIEYMAPEQFSPAKYGIDGKVSSNLDLWSFGIMVHELLTDTTPFGSRDGDTTAEQIMAQILSTELPDGIDRLPEPYKSVVKKCLVANAKERIRRASELVNYFEEPEKAPTKSATQSSQVDDDATKMYPKEGLATQACGLDENPTKMYPKVDHIEGAHQTDDFVSKVKSVLVGSKTRVLMIISAAVIAAIAFDGFSRYVSERDAKVAALEVKIKRDSEAKAADEAKITSELKAKQLTETMAKADELAKLEATAKTKMDGETKTRTDDEIRKKADAVRLFRVDSLTCQIQKDTSGNTPAIYRIKAKGIATMPIGHALSIYPQGNVGLFAHIMLKNEDKINCSSWKSLGDSCTRLGSQPISTDWDAEFVVQFKHENYILDSFSAAFREPTPDGSNGGWKVGPYKNMFKKLVCRT